MLRMLLKILLMIMFLRMNKMLRFSKRVSSSGFRQFVFHNVCDDFFHVTLVTVVVVVVVVVSRNMRSTQDDTQFM